MREQRTVQISVIGAMQRAHPALTELWLQWTGVPDLEHATFDVVRAEEGTRRPATQVMLRPTARAEVTRARLCDLLGLPEGAPERRLMPVHLTGGSEAHGRFWANLRRYEMEQVDGPLEWWWRLCVLRCRGVRAASRSLLTALFGDEPAFDHAVLRLVNQSLRASSTRASGMVDGRYVQPTHVQVTLRVSRKSRHEGLALALADDKLKSRFVTTLIDHAVLSKSA